MCRKLKSIFVVKNKKWSFTLPKSAENLTAQQKALLHKFILHNRKLYCIAESFAAQQKVKESSFRSRSWKNIPFATKMEKGHSHCRKVQKTLLQAEKSVLWQKL